jgi:hypothetical protein
LFGKIDVVLRNGSPASGIDNKGERAICKIINTAWRQLDEESREKKETF